MILKGCILKSWIVKKDAFNFPICELSIYKFIDENTITIGKYIFKYKYYKKAIQNSNRTSSYLYRM
jgi:hypothetical protein